MKYIQTQEKFLGKILSLWDLKRVNGEKREETCFSKILSLWDLKLVLRILVTLVA